MREASSRVLKRFGLPIALLLLSGACSAQSCALCYTQAASSGKRMIQGLRSGIMVLVVPPMFMSAGITVLAYRKRNQSGRPTNSKPSNNGW
jgi:hypothetical protein